MASKEDIDAQWRLLKTYRRTITHLVNQRVKLIGGIVPPSIEHDIYEASQEVQKIKSTLRTWGEEVDDHPMDVVSNTRESEVEHVATDAKTPAIRRSFVSAPRLISVFMCILAFSFGINLTVSGFLANILGRNSAIYIWLISAAITVLIFIALLMAITRINQNSIVLLFGIPVFEASVGIPVPPLVSVMGTAAGLALGGLVFSGARGQAPFVDTATKPNPTISTPSAFPTLVGTISPSPEPPTITPIQPTNVATSLSSHFDGTGVEGWSISPNGSLINPGSAGSGGGASNGYLRWVEKDTDSLTGYYVAPLKYHGDWSKYLMLRFEIQSSGASYYVLGYGFHGDIYLKNGSMTAQYVLDHRPAGGWEAFSIPLTNQSRWVLGGGATRLEEVLRNVTVLEIRAEYGYGIDSSGLDNVALIP